MGTSSTESTVSTVSTATMLMLMQVEVEVRVFFLVPSVVVILEVIAVFIVV